MNQKNKSTMQAYSKLLRKPESFYLDPTYNMARFAEDLHLNRTYTSQFSNDVLGMPFRNLLQSLRLKHAIELMKYKDLSLGDIARLSGFASDISFRRAFQKEFGHNPSENR